jgi:hypothetical protein
MIEAGIGRSIVTTMKAAGYPEREVLMAHPLASISNRYEGRAEYVGQTSEASRAANRLLSR